MHLWLVFQGIFTNSDSHRAKFQGCVEDIVPNQDVSIKTSESRVLVVSRPIVIVCCSHIMRLLATRKRVTDSDNEDSTVFPSYFQLSFSRSKWWEHSFEFFAVNKLDLLWQLCLIVWDNFQQGGLDSLEALEDLVHSRVKILKVSISDINGLFPIELEHIYWVSSVKILFKPSDIVAFGVDTWVGLELMLRENGSLPLGKRVKGFKRGFS